MAKMARTRTSAARDAAKDADRPGPGKIAVIGAGGTVYLKPPVPPYDESLDCDECGKRFEVCMLWDTEEGYAECPHCHVDLRITRVSYLVSEKGQRQ